MRGSGVETLSFIAEVILKMYIFQRGGRAEEISIFLLGVVIYDGYT